MEYKKLGRTEIEVPVICLGTMTWGQQNTEAEAHEQLNYAVEERNIKFIDTAEIYPVPPEREKQGRTETYIGNWLKARGKRDDLFIATKVSSRFQKGSVRERDASEGLTRAGIREAIEGNLRRLQTDYVDLYQVHSPDRSANFWGPRGVQKIEQENVASIEETLNALTELVKEGKVRHIGVSNETPWGIMQYLNLAKEKGLERIVSIQNQYSLTNRTYEIGLSEMTMREEVSLLVYSALGMGALTGKYLGGAKPAGARFTLFERNAERYNPPHAQEAIEAYVHLAKKYGIEPAQMAIAYAVSREFATSTIIGATSLLQLKSDIDAGELILPQELLADIEELYTIYPDPTA